MQEIAKGRTVFIIAHRLSTVRRTDRIITIDAGRVVEDGSHDHLIKTGGRYASLHRLQAGIHEVHLGERPQLDAIVDRRGLTDLKAQVDQGVLAPIYERIKAELSRDV
jgi:ABC-type multidrug transport system ATPase subunit